MDYPKEQEAANAPRIAQDAPGEKPAFPSVQTAASDPGEDLKAMRADLREALRWLEKSKWTHDHDFAAKMRIKWGIK